MARAAMASIATGLEAGAFVPTCIAA
jgi:hypothetical protein